MKLNASTRLQDPTEIQAASEVVPTRKSEQIAGLVGNVEDAIDLVGSIVSPEMEKKFHAVMAKADGRTLSVDDFEKFKVFAEGYDKKLATAITALEGARHFIARLNQIEVK